jgi:type I restriction enzyme, S subunit
VTELPRGWAIATIGEVADTQLGKMLSAKARSGNGARPYLRNKNVQWGRIDLDDLLVMDFSDEEFEKFRLRPSDLLVCEGGEVGRAAIWRGTIECAFQKALHRVRPRGGVLPEFLLYLLMHYAATREFERYVTGSTIAHLPQEDLRRLPVPLPPLAEQRRIVMAMEEHLSRLDSARESLSRVQRLLERWRSSTLAALNHPGARQRRIGDIARVASGATPKRDRPDYWIGGDVPWVTSGQLTQPFVSEPAAHITQKALDETSCRVWPKGTLLVAMYGEGKTRGHCSELLIDAATNQACAAIQIDDPEVDPAFLKLYFNATYSANRSLSAGGVQPNLSLGLIKDMSVPCPPIKEQRAIVASIERQLARAVSLSIAVGKARADASGLQRSILSRAFRGELVPQDPTDEPASALLERVAATRGAVPTATRKRRLRTPA